MAEFAQEAIIGRPAATSYSFCGLQWKSTEFIRQAIAPMARRMQDEGVAAVLLTPARPFCCQSAGLAARCLEAEGFCTVALAPTPEFHREVGIPCSAAIEYPYGRPVGAVGDCEGQRRVLLAALAVFEHARHPGEVHQLPFTWPEDPRDIHRHPPGMSPIIKAYLNEIKAARR